MAFHPFRAMPGGSRTPLRGFTRAEVNRIGESQRRQKLSGNDGWSAWSATVQQQLYSFVRTVAGSPGQTRPFTKEPFGGADAVARGEEEPDTNDPFGVLYAPPVANRATAAISMSPVVAQPTQVSIPTAEAAQRATRPAWGA